MKKWTTFGVAGIWINDASRVAFLPNTDAINISDNANLINVENAFGITIDLRTGTKPVELSFTARGLSPLALSIMGGYDLTQNVANAQKQAFITGVKGDWSGVASVVTQADAVPGIYHIEKTAGAFKTQKLASLTADLAIDAPESTADIPGVALNGTNALETGDYAIVDVYPATSEQGTITPGIEARPNIGISAASDTREASGAAMSIYIPAAKIGNIPFNFAANAEMTHELSGMSQYSSQIGGYFRISQLVTPE